MGIDSRGLSTVGFSIARGWRRVYDRKKTAGQSCVDEERVGDERRDE